MVGAKSGTWIYPVICFFFLLASLEVDALGVPMTLLHSAVAKGAGMIIRKRMLSPEYSHMTISS